MATKITGTNTAAAPGVTGDDTDTGLFYGTNEIGFSTGGTSRMTLDSSGRVGIGEASPDSLLHLTDSTDGGSSLSNLISISRRSGGSNDAVIQTLHDGSDGISALTLKFATNERLRIDSSGSLKFNQAQSKILANTASGSDSSWININGGGDASQSRGAGLAIYGNNNSGSEGKLWLLAGNSGSANGVIAMNTAGSERLRIDSSGRVLIGDGSSTAGVSGTGMRIDSNNVGSNYSEGAISLHGTGGDFYAMTMRDSSNNGWGLLNVFSSTPDRLSIGYYDATAASNKTVFTSYSNGNVAIGDGDLVIGTAGHGIDFSANSHAGGMTSELLDSYEEGTFTPVLGGITNHSTYNVSGSALYTKIGRLVNCQIFFSDKNLNDTAAGQVRISGLPFTSSSAVQYTTTPTGYSYKVSFTTDRIQSWYVNTNATTMDGMQSVSGAAWVGWDVSNFLSADMHLRINLTYYAA